MLKLREIQQNFTNDLLNYSNTLSPHIHTTTALTASDRIEIYRSSMIALLQKSLMQTYEACYKLVGEEFFIYLANEFIETQPSFSPDLNDYGGQFPTFLQQHPKNSLLYLADMARFEWAYHQAFDAPNYQSLDVKKLQTLPDEDYDYVVFQLPPASTLLASPFPLIQIWEMNQAEACGTKTLMLPENSQFYFFIWRKELEMRVEQLQEKQYKLLKLIQEGHALGNICQEFIEVDLLQMLSDFTRNQWLAGFKIMSV